MLYLEQNGRGHAILGMRKRGKIQNGFLNISGGRMPLTRLVMVEVKVVRNGDVVEMRARKWSGFMCK